MKIEHTDKGAVGYVTLTSTIFEFRKHCRIADAILFSVPGVVRECRGKFFIKTLISGRSREAIRAYRVAVRESQR
ncbi:hypothetical protein [Dryocola sp. LX212]